MKHQIIYTTKYLLTALFLFLILGSCSKNDNSDNVNKQLKKEQIVEASNKFGLNLFQELNNIENDSVNLFYSPLSVSFALGMTYNGANGNTKDEFKKTLGFENLTDEEINETYSDLIKEIVISDSKVSSSIANSIWIREGFQPFQTFIDVNKNYFDAEIRTENFSDPQTLQIINQWVADKTNDKIQNILNSIPPDAIMYLINAIYFKADWKFQFDEEATKPAMFYPYSDNAFETPFMNQKIKPKNYSNDKFSMLELPYDNEKFSMLLFLPNSSYTTNDIIDDFSSNNWNTWINSLEYNDSIIVSLPKFSFTYKTLLNQALKNLGIVDAFSGDADFSNITDIYQLFISRVIHKAFIKVNEQGSEAVAATVVEMCFTSAEPEKAFIFNQPFVFAIVENNTNAILFMSEVLHPVIED